MIQNFIFKLIWPPNGARSGQYKDWADIFDLSDGWTEGKPQVMWLLWRQLETPSKSDETGLGISL